ncbi:MAG: endonuclease/exonuclease/phosphatase family protein, partial [Cetobacterium sp.]
MFSTRNALEKSRSQQTTQWIGQIFHSNFGAKSRGTAILIKKTVPFIASKIIPDSHEQFINSLLLKIPDMDSHQLIIGGDFNLVLDTDLDRSSRRPVTVTKMAKSVKKFMDTYKIIDPWRTLHPNTRQYSYYSPVHQTYTRIDYFLIDSKLLQQTKHCNYETLMLSDHSPLTLHLIFGYNQTSKIWRFDNSILSSKKGVEEIKKQINLYLSFNDTPDVTKSTLWEALKAFIRGQVISWKSLKNKLQR